jgi:acyl-CoA synthetase (AMP-forming)/AMP-acid ligase II
MKYFWIDSSRQEEVTYEDFFRQLLDEGTNSVFVKAENPYYLFLNLLRNCINGKESIILDADFSSQELDSLGVTIEEINKSEYEQPSLRDKFIDFDDVLFFLETNKHILFVQIFTSGTTGQPKKVFQSLLNLTRAVKKDIKYGDNIWAFAYNASHFAGLQVFFQALFNKNKIVYIFNSDYKLIYSDLINHDITHLSCTPTFLKMLLPNIVQPIRTMTSITSGGEKFDARINDNISYLFPKAVIKNVYASTEAGSLLMAMVSFLLYLKDIKRFLKLWMSNYSLIRHY